jgi:hypothetical protein
MTWIIPTLSRPKQVAELVAHITALDGTSRGIVFVNHLNDEMVAEYFDTVGNHLPAGWELWRNGKNLGAIGAMNEVFRVRPDEPFYGFIGDDEVIYTKDWNKRLVEAAGANKLSHTNDGWQSGPRIHSYVCIGGDLIRAIGYMAVPTCWHWFGFDCMWELIAQQLPVRVFLHELEAEHRHFLNYKVKKDVCYAIGESMNVADEKAFALWMKEEYPQVLERLKKVVGV